jgi:ABC-type phosphate transport system substrate-binding protein
VKRFRIRGAYAAVGALAALGAAFVFATGGGAALTPSQGTGCSTDGKIDGRGSTFQSRALAAFATGYESRVCGVQTDSPSVESGYTGPSYIAGPFPNPNMVQYNVYDGVPTGVAKVIDGSGNGLDALACRADLFAGTDTPYTSAQLTGEDAAPSTMNDAVLGGTATCTSKFLDNNSTPAFTPPYEPLGTGVPVGTAGFPNSADTAGNLMSFPVGGSAVAIGVNLNGAGCTTIPTAVSFTGQMLADLFGGDILTWNDPRLREGGLNAGLANCTGAVTRIVRQDNSGTSQIFKNYLQFIDPSRTGEAADATANGAPTICQSALTWTTLQQRSPNYDWPGFDSVSDGFGGPTTPAPTGNTQTGAAATTNCSAIDTGDVSGNPGVLDICEGGTAGTQPIAGAICYADLPDLKNFSCVLSTTNPGPGCHTPLVASVENSAGTSAVQPNVGLRANCTYNAVTGPSGGPSGAVGLTTGDTWALDNATNYGDVAAQSPNYPICGLTWDLVYSGLSGTVGPPPVAQTIYADASQDQIRTLYSFFDYVLSSTGQSDLISKYYAQLPASLAASEQSGFESHF